MKPSGTACLIAVSVIAASIILCGQDAKMNNQDAPFLPPRLTPEQQAKKQEATRVLAEKKAAKEKAAAEAKRLEEEKKAQPGT